MFNYKIFLTMNKKFFVMAAIAATVFGLAFTSCSNDDEMDAPVQSSVKKGPRAVNFNVVSNNNVTTRGLDGNIADIQVDGFKTWAFDATSTNDGATAFMSGVACSWDGTNSWFAPATSYYWPEYNLSFIAMTPGTAGTPTVTQPTAGIPQAVMNYTVPETVSEQKDIMFAGANDKDYSDCSSDKLPLTFQHALSQIVFKGFVDGSSTISKAHVTNISLVHINKTGTVTYVSGTGASWASQSGDATNVANIVNADVTASTTDASPEADDITGSDVTDALAYNNSTTRTQQLLVLPQTVNSGVSGANISQRSAPATGTYLLVNADLYANGDNDNKVLESSTDVYIPLNEVTWQPGYKYTYTLTFGDNLLHPILFSGSVQAWTAGAGAVEF